MQLEKDGPPVRLLRTGDAQVRPAQWLVSTWRTLLPLFGLAAFWALEDWFVQGAAFDVSPSYHHPYLYPVIRFTLNFCIAFVLLLLFSRPLLVLFALVDFFVSSVVLAYAQYFNEPLSLLRIFDSLKEGARVAGFGIQVVPPGIWVLLFLILTSKVVWIWKLKRIKGRCRWISAGMSLATFAGIILILQCGSYRLSSVRNVRGTGIAFCYGYPATWVAEYFFGADMKDISAEISRLRGLSPDRLQGTEVPWPVGDKIAVVQLESVGWNILNVSMNGTEVTPYLNNLLKTSRAFRIHAYHSTGSADMDFAVLSGGAPDPRTINYAVPGLTYSNSLPEFFEKNGFHTVSMHGNAGSFFNRRPNLVRMGFDELWFKDDFRDKDVQRSSWGIRDQELFRLSANEMRNAIRPEFHFLITLDSHAPFNLIRNDEQTIFPGSLDWRENYFNSMHVLDAAIRDYTESLPDGTLLILYGDHTAGVVYRDFHSARDGVKEYVPCIIHLCGSGKEWLPVGNSPVTNQTDLRILDIMNFLRQQVSLRDRSRR